MTKLEKVRQLYNLGMSRQGIADTLGVQLQTVRAYIWRIGNYEAYKAYERGEKIRRSRQLGVRPRAEYLAVVKHLDPDRDAVIRKYYRRRSAAEIAAMLGTTRNAVIGRAYRLGL